MCLAALRQSEEVLAREGFAARPSWDELRQGARPEAPASHEAGAWRHGSQYVASAIRETFFRKTSMLAIYCAADCAHLRSHSGCNAGAALGFAPTSHEFVVRPLLFWTLLLEIDALATSACRCKMRSVRLRSGRP